MAEIAFEDQLAVFAAKALARTNNTIKDICYGVAASLITKSPIGDPSLWQHPAPKGYIPGTFKANWRASIDAINYTTVDEQDPSGEASMLQVASVLADADLKDKVIYITNSLPYGQVLEDGSHSKQVPPGGMVALTVVEYKEIAGAAILKNISL